MPTASTRSLRGSPAGSAGAVQSSESRGSVRSTKLRRIGLANREARSRQPRPHYRRGTGAFGTGCREHLAGRHSRNRGADPPFVVGTLIVICLASEQPPRLLGSGGWRTLASALSRHRQAGSNRRDLAAYRSFQDVQTDTLRVDRQPNIGWNPAGPLACSGRWPFAVPDRARRPIPC